ncbi:DUF4445 domain-containing protein [candidate division WOR-3 bacterium]|nr:DUF4445 domain-containing protein [candidate division WOR-3 bacterium]
MKNRIYFPQFDKSKLLEKGQTILKAAQDLGVPINAGCGGLGICGECKVKIEKGAEALNKRTKAEEKLGKDERLACQAVIENDKYDVYVSVIQAGFITNILTHGENRREISLNPFAKRRGDKVLLGEEEIDDYKGGIFGIAADVGTTTVVLHLINLEKGNIVYTSAFENPQKRLGGDNVISRIQFDGKDPGKLQSILISKINEEIKEMPVDFKNIYDFVVVGNSTMRDLFFGLDVQSIGVSPFKSVTETDEGTIPLKMKAPELNIYMNKEAQVYGPPLIGSHVGADALAVSLSCGVFDNVEENIMCIDIGTNGEVVLKTDKGIIATSCAAGPALEPMSAVPGAISRFSIDKNRNRFETIGSAEPIGICGSGIIDILGELIKNDLMNEDGYLRDKKDFVIKGNVKITQKDIKGESGLLWSKAAISLGIKALLEEANLTTDDLDRVYLAGSFGTYIDKESAKIIGLVPDISSEKIIQVGNAAALGAQEMLLCLEMRNLAESSANEIKHIHLESIPNYGERLMLVEQKFKRLSSESS